MSDDAMVDSAGHARLSRFGLLAGLFLLVAVLSGIWSTVAFHLSSDAIDRAKDTVIRLERLLSTMKDLETGQRGYLLTGDDSYLEPYRAAEMRIEPELDDMTGLDVDLPTLRSLVAERHDIAARTVVRFRAEGRSADSTSIRIGEGKAAMDRLRGFVAETQERVARTIRATLVRDRIVLWPFELLTVLVFRRLLKISKRRKEK